MEKEISMEDLGKILNSVPDGMIIRLWVKGKTKDEGDVEGGEEGFGSVLDQGSSHPSG